LAEALRLRAIVLPFSKTSVRRARDAGVWIERGWGWSGEDFSKERIRKIHHAYKVLLASKLNTSQALEKLKAEANIGDDVAILIQFIEASERGVIK